MYAENKKSNSSCVTNQCDDSCCTYVIMNIGIVNHVIDVNNIVNVCYYFKVDNVMYVAQPANFNKIV